MPSWDFQFSDQSSIPWKNDNRKKISRRRKKLLQRVPLEKLHTVKGSSLGMVYSWPYVGKAKLHLWRGGVFQFSKICLQLSVFFCFFLLLFKPITTSEMKFGVSLTQGQKCSVPDLHPKCYNFSNGTPRTTRFCSKIQSSSWCATFDKY